MQFGRVYTIVCNLGSSILYPLIASDCCQFLFPRKFLAECSIIQEFSITLSSVIVSFFLLFVNSWKSIVKKRNVFELPEY